MSVDRPESYLTNLDLEIRINRGGMTVSGGDLSAGRSGRDGDRPFVDLVGRASGAATAELVNARGRQADNEPDLVGEIVAGPTEPQAQVLATQVLATQVLPAQDPLSPQHDPALLAAKEIRKPDAPVFVADTSPIVRDNQPPRREFELPPQHIIDAKLITVTQTPPGADGVPLEPVEKTMVRVSDRIVLPTPDVLIAEQNSFQENIKSLNVPTSQIIEQCQAELSRASELFPLLTQSYVDSFDLDQTPEQRAQSNQLTLFYLDKIASNLDFLNNVCHPYLTAEEIRQLDIIDRNANSIIDLLGIEPEPSTLDRVREFLLDVQSQLDEYAQENGPMMPPIPPFNFPDMRWLFRNRH